MRRADRLFQIIQLLRGRGRTRTAKWLAEQLEVSERTVYRDHLARRRQPAARAPWGGRGAFAAGRSCGPAARAAILGPG